LGIGGLIYRIRKQFEGGLTASWYREKVRPRILSTPSLLLPLRGEYEIHVLTSESDWLNLVWALKSFFLYAEVRVPLCIHEDGSLSPAAREQLQTHFVGCRLMSRPEADEDVLAALSGFPRCREFRAANNLSLKVFDTRHHAQAGRILLLDSDVLFFRRPDALLQSLADERTLIRFNRDLADAYTADRRELESALGMPVAERFNSGLCVLQRDALRLDWLEEFLSREELEGHFWRIEQTLFCLCGSRYGAQALPEDYDVVLEGNVSGRVVKHYVGAIRQRMYAEGIRHLVGQGFLETLHTAPSPPLGQEPVP
jgi:hypothetical protein